MEKKRNDLIKPEDYIKPKQSRYYVPKITKKSTEKAMRAKKRYMQPMKPLHNESYIVEANKVLNIAESYETSFKLSIKPPEAHKMAIRINQYLESEAERNKTPFNPIDYKIVLAAFEKMRTVYCDLLFYFRGFEGGPYDIDKGIYIHGGTGSGKTLVMKIFKEYTKKCLQANSFRMVEASTISDKATKKGINALDQFVRSQETYTPINMYIEDFGASPKQIRAWGNLIDPMGELIMRRYNYFKKYGTLTHLCTNIKPSDLPNHFGPRVCSRFHEMFNIVNFNIFDWRKV